MALSMTDENALRPILAGSPGSAHWPDLSTAADASPRWSDPDPRPESDHRLPAARTGAARPALTFPTGGGHQCDQYRMVCGFYECAHGHVLRINAHARGGQR
ncbi:hypothetical protein [Saccharopolyspora hattusasensis]|uniref:hypothetical protein n=1 Tax=Saccharopolyspora hattusasensis TaxID=1128679 RepID=UPI003D95FC2A